MPFILGEQFHYGPGFDADRLPDGWELIESQNEFARARDPKGNEYLLHTNGANPTVVTKGVRTVDPSVTIPYRTPNTP